MPVKKPKKETESILILEILTRDSSVNTGGVMLNFFAEIRRREYPS
tara:strand:- start:982 stop:1119 length:138 start_codon:yes stop_codon:yes gene_type:complete